MDELASQDTSSCSSGSEYLIRAFNATVKSLTDVCQPAKFNLAIATAKKSSGFDDSKNIFITFSLEREFKYSLQKILRYCW